MIAVAACATGSSGADGGDEDDGGGGTGATGGHAGGGGSGATGGEAGAGAIAAMGGAGGGAGAASGGMGGAGGATGGGGSGGSGMPVIWINEIHYDNNSTDTNEGVEVAGTAGLALNQYELQLYSNGTLYDTVALAGTLPNQQNNFGTSFAAAAGLQNGPNDGVALVVVATAQVVQLLSYEGTFTAADGAAAGLPSIDIGVSEDSMTAIGQSLQLIGTGSDYASFTWTGPVTSSPALPNTGQTFF
jgi:hypothetical protein